MKDEKRRAATHTESTKAPLTDAEVEKEAKAIAEQLQGELLGRQVEEIASLRALDAELAEGMRTLVGKAITLAKAEKPDVRLLRLICRYSHTASRKVDAHFAKFPPRESRKK